MPTKTTRARTPRMLRDGTPSLALFFSSEDPEKGGP
jgi:hypothetical protein